MFTVPYHTRISFHSSNPYGMLTFLMQVIGKHIHRHPMVPYVSYYTAIPYGVLTSYARYFLYRSIL